jgi:hypothetical protein
MMRSCWDLQVGTESCDCGIWKLQRVEQCSRDTKVLFFFGFVAEFVLMVLVSGTVNSIHFHPNSLSRC